MGVHKQVVAVHLQQNRHVDPARHNLFQELSQALTGALQDLLQHYARRGTPLDTRDRLYFSILGFH